MRACAGPVAVYDPEGIAAALLALYPDAPPFIGLYVHDVTAVGEERAGYVARALTELPDSGARIVLIAAFDAGRIAARIAHLLPPGAEVVTLDEVKLPDALLTNRARYLDKLNFATNFVFFRDADGLSTRLVSANYWAGYGGGAIRLWLRLFDAAGTVLATWEQEIPAGPCGFSIDSRVVRERFGLPQFTGQLFVHAIGAVGPRRGEIRARHVCQRRHVQLGRQPVVHARRQRLAVGSLCRPAGAARGRAGDPVAAEQSRHADPGRGGGARPHGRGAAGRRWRRRWDRSPPSPWMWRRCCPICAGRRRSRCGPGGTWCGRATR